MGKHNSGGILVWIIAGSLLLFTAFRSVHLVSSTLPGDAQILGFAALFALDLGVIAWMIFATHGARGTQHTIAVIMVCVDLAGVSAAVLGDTMLIAGGGAENGLVSTVALWIVPIIIILNVSATVMCHLVDPAQSLRDANRSLQDELEMQVAKGIAQNASQVAAGVTPSAIRARQDEMIAGFLAGMKDGGKSSSNKAAPQMATLAADSPVEIEAPAQRGRPKKSR